MNHHHSIRSIIGGILSTAAAFALFSSATAEDGFGQVAADESLDLSGVEVDEFDTFNIQVTDTDLAQVLQMLALQGERNVIASRNVSAVISANLFDVTFEEALDAILKPNGFRWIEEGKFIYVYTQEEFARMEALDRKTESRMFELEHISARDASEFATPLLSDRGKLSFIGEVAGGIERDLGDMGGDNWAKSAILVVNDYPDKLDRIAELLGEIDTAPRQVVVDATIASVQVAEDDAFGVDFSIMGNLDITKLVSPLGPVTDMLRGTVPPKEGGGGVPVYNNNNTSWGTQSTPGNTATGPSNFKVGLVAGDASVFVRALDQVTDTMVLARPRIMALNRQRAQVMVGKRVAYLSTTATDTTTTQTVQYLDTGVKLMFRPFISKDDTIRMELYPSVSSAELRTLAVGISEGLVQVPDEFTNEISTNVKVRDGQTLVLGGLFEEQTTVSNSQVPLLGDIPILGAAFSGHDNSVSRREIIFMITPKIVADELIDETGRQGKEFVNSLRAGMREGLLPFSREKMSSQSNQNAFEAINSNDFELAMFHFDSSLRLNPNQPEVRRMRSEIAGESKVTFYDYDIWRRVMDSQHADHEDAQSEEARVNPAVDPLVSVKTEPVAPESDQIANRVEAREDRFLSALVSEIDRESSTNASEEDGSAIYLVEPEPMSVAAAFGDLDESETTAFAGGTAATTASPITEKIASQPKIDDSTGETPVRAAKPSIELPSLAELVDSKAVAETPIATAPVAPETGSTVVDEPVMAVATTPIPTNSGSINEFTNADALRVVADAQMNLVRGEPSPSWGRLWWLARIASEQARVFSKDAGSATTPPMVAGVNERE
jgi:type IV pilus assembly protein PilQ